jgi:hypothetical protein
MASEAFLTKYRCEGSGYERFGKCMGTKSHLVISDRPDNKGRPPALCQECAEHCASMWRTGGWTDARTERCAYAGIDPNGEHDHDACKDHDEAMDAIDARMDALIEREGGL